MVAPRIPTIADRIDALDWNAMECDLWDHGYAETPVLLTPTECADLIALYPNDALFRSRVDMAHHRFGVGDYQYFAHPLPPIVQALRVHAYPHLAAIANRWHDALGIDDRFPERLEAFLAECANNGQSRPTPLLLHYEEGGYNCLHQDIYGAVAFPMQLLAFLGQPGEEYTGGEFLLVEQRPRAQSAGEVIPGVRGGLVFFTTRIRPAKGSRGSHRVNMRHGVSRVRGGTRHTLGVIFHNAT